MHEVLLKTLNGIVPLEAFEQKLFTELFVPKYLKKGEHFLKVGKPNKLLGFLQKGLVRYYVHKNDSEATLEFSKEGEFIAEYQSFSSRDYSMQNIQAIEDCEMLVIDYEGLQLIYNETLNGNLLGRMIIEHRHNVMIKQLLSIYMHTPEERYQYFADHYSDLMQRIPQYLIASYLGVQPQSLSRIRRRLATSSI